MAQWRGGEVKGCLALEGQKTPVVVATALAALLFAEASRSACAVRVEITFGADAYLAKDLPEAD